MYKLRDYQQKAVDAAVQFFNTNTRRNGLIVLPTGAGKSLVIAAIAKELYANVLVFQPSKEILEQNYNKVRSYDIEDVGIYSASMGRKEIAGITFATIGSVRNCKESFIRFRYVIIDECHNVNPREGMYADFINATKCKVVGLTATPYRLVSSHEYGSILKFLTRTRPRVFDDVLYYCQVGELLEKGYLADLSYYQLKLVDQSKLRLNSTGADFSEQSLRLYYHQHKFSDSLENVIERLLKVGRTKILVFTRFLEEAEALTARCSAPSAMVSGETRKADREQILKDFKEGRIHVVTNVGVLTTGFDYPELDTVVLARPTMSLALYYQMVGRAIRPYPDKQGWIVDLCGNYARFGKVADLMLTEPRPGMYQIENKTKVLTNVYFNTPNETINGRN